MKKETISLPVVVSLHDMRVIDDHIDCPAELAELTQKHFTEILRRCMRMHSWKSNAVPEIYEYLIQMFKTNIRVECDLNVREDTPIAVYKVFRS